MVWWVNQPFLSLSTSKHRIFNGIPFAVHPKMPSFCDIADIHRLNVCILISFISELDYQDQMIRVDWCMVDWISRMWTIIICSSNSTLMIARELPEAKKHRLKDVNQVHAMSQVADTDKMLKGNVRYLPNAVWVRLFISVIVELLLLH